MKNQIAIQMDKIENIDYEFDTSFLIGYEGQLRNYQIFYYNPCDLIIKNGNVQANGFYLKLYLDKNNYFEYDSEKIIVNLKEFKYVFLRQDPPFDMNYITTTYLLEYLSPYSIVINNPSAIRSFSEKISAFRFKKFIAPTLITQDTEILRKFLSKHKDIVTKPLYGNGGEGIFRSTIKNNKLNGINERKRILKNPIMAQKYIPEIKKGDRRLILIDGDYVGSVARIPKKGKLKANFHAGGFPQKTGLVRRDKEICRALKKN